MKRIAILLLVGAMLICLNAVALSYVLVHGDGLEQWAAHLANVYSNSEELAQ